MLKGQSSSSTQSMSKWSLPQSLAHQGVLQVPHLPEEGQKVDLQLLLLHSSLVPSQALAFLKHQEDFLHVPSHTSPSCLDFPTPQSSLEASASNFHLTLKLRDS